MAGDRVHYRERQRLREEDLGDEQAYHIHVRRRHNIAQHGWGIVRGLAMRLELGSVVLSPGLAVDGYGRELIVSRSIEISDALLSQLLDQEVLKGKEIGANDVGRYAIDVWLNYRTRTVEPDEHSVELEFFKGTARVCEESWVKLLCADPASPANPYLPPGVPVTDLDYPPHRSMAIDADRPWPVYLGRIGADERMGGYEYSLRVANRPFATLVGAGISSPWNGSWMQVGTSLFSDKNRFSVELPDTSGTPVRRFSLDKDGNTVLKGDVGFRRDQPLQGPLPGQISLIPTSDGKHPNPALGFDALKSAPEEAAPWQMYRAELKDENAQKQQLRFELFHPGGEGDPALSQWIIGGETGGIADSFGSLLSVRADGTVVMRGDVTVQGHYIEGPVPLDFNDPRFRDELLTRWSKGLTTASQEVDAFYAVILDIDIAFLDGGGVPVATEDLRRSATYDIRLTIRNVSRELTIRLLQIEFAVEYFARGTLERTLIALPPEPEMVAGETIEVISEDFQFSTDGQVGTEKAQASIIITAAGLAQNTANPLQSVDITLSD